MHYQNPNGGFGVPASPFQSSFQSIAPTWDGSSHLAANFSLAHAIDSLPQYLRNWTYAISRELEVDLGMSLATLLSGMATAVHGSKLVERPDGGREPLAYFSVVLAGATTGKTRTHKLVHAAHHAEDIRRYKAYQLAKKSIKRRAASDSAPECDSGPVRLRPVILQDTSNRGLLEVEEGVGESTAISIHEGQNVLGSTLFRDHLGTLNLLYDSEGKAMLRRGNNDLVIAFDASLNLLVMVQPDIFAAYLQKHRDSVRDIGFLARCMFTCVPLAGECADPSIQVPEGCLDGYHAQVEKLLTARLERLEAGDTNRDAVRLSDQARELWWQLAGELKYLTSTRYWHVQDAANRAMQNTLRLAGIIHCYSGESGEIRPETLYAAWAIIQWHMGQFAELFPPKPLPPPAPFKLTSRGKQIQRELDDAKAILDCIAELCWRSGEPSVLKSKVFIRSGLYNARFRTALMRLIDEGKVLESEEGRQARLSIIPPRDSFAGNQLAWSSSASASL
jgi:hypothetical protein